VRSGTRNKVTARFPELAIWRGSRLYCRQEHASLVSNSHVRRAREARIERHNLTETKIREMIEEGTLLIDTTARASSSERLECSRNRRVRLRQARANYGVRGAGQSGLINVEREST